jgi:hypothetical protein
MSDPFNSPLLWDRLELHGSSGKVTVPGVASVDVTVAINEDTVDVPGQDGATTTVLGYKPAEITVNLQLWTPEQFKRFKNVITVYRPKRGQAPKAVDVVHPKLALYGIRQAYIFSINDPPYDPVNGYRVTLQMREWWPESKKKTRGTSAVAPGTRANAAANGSRAAGNGNPEGTDWGAPLEPTKPSTVPPKPRRP